MNGTFRIYSQHKGSNVELPRVSSLDELRALADAAASRGVDALYRAFEVTSKSVTGERFATAYSVLGGVVREHPDVTIPTAHW